MGRVNWSKLHSSLGLIREARDRGLQVSTDVYPYTGTATALGAVVRIHGTDEDARGDGIRITYEVPHQGPVGIRLVPVNGDVVIRDGVHTGQRPGQVLGRGRQ